jgi:LPXTG-site transpeptidase (sortase) family protein
LVIVGAALLLWCASLVIDGWMAQQSARESLEGARAVVTAVRTVPAPAVIGSTDVAPAVPAVPRGAALAALSIPRVHLSAVVLHGSDARTLRRGPGHLEHTPLPGEAGNVVIAGHRDSFFRPLRDIQVGDDIFVDTPERRFHYRVSWLRVVNAHEVSVLDSTDEATLTLITCYPFWVLGNAPDRFVVRAAAVVDGAVAPFASHKASAADSIGATPGEEVVVAGPVEASVVEGPADPEISPVQSDDQLVRAAVERYRIMYNGRLVARNEVDSVGPLTFRTCEVVVASDDATVRCEASPQPSSGSQPTARTFMLVRAAGRWAIKTIVLH